MSFAELVIWAASAWLIVGCAVAVIFLSFGADRLLEGAREVYVFRVLVAPGIVLIWPVVLWRWYDMRSDNIAWQDHHTPSRRLAGWLEIAMALSLLVLLVAAAVQLGRPDASPEPVRLTGQQPQAKPTA